mmetsp:Transcript_51516/g.70176  ORF Transcript_51516/g.70176 Transcript_51516/m.70176 type:complete len:116 (+) Transcript_51516:1200-1547(+)
MTSTFNISRSIIHIRRRGGRGVTYSNWAWCGSEWLCMICGSSQDEALPDTRAPGGQSKRSKNNKSDQRPPPPKANRMRKERKVVERKSTNICRGEHAFDWKRSKPSENTSEMEYP